MMGLLFLANRIDIALFITWSLKIKCHSKSDMFQEVESSNQKIILEIWDISKDLELV